MNLDKLKIFSTFVGVMLMYMLAARYLSTSHEVQGLIFKGIGFLLITITLIMSVPYDIKIEEGKDERSGHNK